MPSSRLLCPSSALLCVLIVSSSHMCPPLAVCLCISRLLAVFGLMICLLSASALCICIYLDTLYTYLLTRYLYTVHTDMLIPIPIQYIEIYYTYSPYIYCTYIPYTDILNIYYQTIYYMYSIYTVHIQILYTYTPYNYKYNINILIAY